MFYADFKYFIKRRILIAVHRKAGGIDFFSGIMSFKLMASKPRTHDKFSVRFLHLQISVSQDHAASSLCLHIKMFILYGCPRRDTDLQAERKPF